MSPIKIVLLAMLLSAASGCSSESWKRTGYETLQNIKQQQCDKNPSASGECGERKSYDAYQREVKELDTNEISDQLNVPSHPAHYTQPALPT
jgi:hypothetical protein